MTEFQESLEWLPSIPDALLTPQQVNLTGILVIDAAILAEIKTWSQPFGVGMVHHARVQPEGDPVWQKTIPATGSWDGAVLASPSPPQGTVLREPNAPMDCQQVFPTVGANRGFFLRWIVAGTRFHNPDNILNFHFGQYCLCIHGDGLATLCEWCRPRNDNTYRWARRKAFRYCPPGHATANTHTMMIFPVWGAGGEKFIYFVSSGIDNNQQSLTRGDPMATNETAFEASQLNRFEDQDESPGEITKSAPVRLDIRRDIRVGWNVSKLVYSTGGGTTGADVGFLADSAWHIPKNSNATYYGLRLFCRIPEGMHIRAAINNAEPWGAGINPVQEIIYPAANKDATQYILQPNAFSVAPTFYFEHPTADYTRDTPIFYGYELRRDAVTIVDAPGAISSVVDSVRVSSQMRDASMEQGHVTLSDKTNSLSRIARRGEFVAKLIVEATVPTDPIGDPYGMGTTTTAKITVFKGRAVRPRRIRHGQEGQKVGGGGSGATRLYPHAEWSTYDIALAPEVDRLREYSASKIDIKNFGQDENAPVDPVAQIRPPWKVTDAIRWMLRYAVGYPANRLEIEDNPIRLWIPPNGLISDLEFNPNVDVWEMCRQMARNYLGGYLVYDLSAGPLAGAGRPDTGSPEGAWKILFPPPEDAPPVFHFVAKKQRNVIGDKYPGAFNANTIGVSGPLESYVIAPEFNHVWVFTAPPLPNTNDGFRVSSHLFNHRSYKVPGSSVVPDPDSPHYIGREKLCILPDPTLMVGGPDWGPKTKQACDLVATRLLMYAGRGITIQPLRGPLAILWDAGIGRWRTLRFGDPVTWKGESGWFIRSVDASYALDSNQEADYELMRLEPL